MVSLLSLIDACFSSLAQLPPPQSSSSPAVGGRSWQWSYCPELPDPNLDYHPDWACGPLSPPADLWNPHQWASLGMSHILHQNIHWCLQWTCINHVCQSQWDHWAVFEHQTNKSIFIKQPDKTTLDRLNYGQKHFTFNCGVFSPPIHLRLYTCQCFIYLIGQIYSSKDPRMTVLMVMMCLNGRLSNHLLMVL